MREYLDTPNRESVSGDPKISKISPKRSNGRVIHRRASFVLQGVLFSIGSAFLYYVNHFKLYSSFCASHSKAQKVLHPSKYRSISLQYRSSFSFSLSLVGDRRFLGSESVNTPAIDDNSFARRRNNRSTSFFTNITPPNLYYSCQPSRARLTFLRSRIEAASLKNTPEEIIPLFLTALVSL